MDCTIVTVVLRVQVSLGKTGCHAFAVVELREKPAPEYGNLVLLD
jgi:hypothetical protein